MEQGWVVEGRYGVERRLGAGGGAGAGREGVWQAVDTAAQRPVAIRFVVGTDAAQRFQDRVRVLSQPSPTIVTCHDSGTTAGPDGSPASFLVMERLEGHTLAAELADTVGNWAPRTAGTLVTDVLRGLEHLHAGGLAHGGVRPSNILLTDDLDRPVILLDAGLPGLPVPAADDSFFAAPERPADARSDFYGAGRVLVAMLHHDDDGRLAPLPYLAVVQRLTARDPAERPQDAAACIALLRDAMTDGSTLRPEMRPRTPGQLEALRRREEEQQADSARQ
ncbi:protein kinase domain-containing protein [Streptomyces sp. NRRL S-350]|uniref:protein kinase domain-containing protein n=1 Tax=Streptomyces sp. NRRL S-350 TaxID=1463902 RepID=UPI0004BF88D3|nr:protein kinase [Streptomyces sp. NRRL S-350]